jgi:hypothetical protein
MANALNWFDIPVADMARAVQFYSIVLGMTLKADPAAPGYEMTAFPVEGVGGALMSGPGYAGFGQMGWIKGEAYRAAVSG